MALWENLSIMLMSHKENNFPKNCFECTEYEERYCLFYFMNLMLNLCNLKALKTVRDILDVDVLFNMEIGQIHC